MRMNQIRGILFKSQDLADESDPLYWNQLIFSIFSILLVTGGSVLLFYGVREFLRQGQPILAISEVVIFLLFVLTVISRRVSFTLRKILVVYVLLLLGFLLIVTTGPYGASTAYIFSSFICAGLFMRMRGLIIHLFLNVLGYALISLFLFTGRLSDQPVFELYDTWVIVMLNPLLTGSLLGLLVNIITRGLESMTFRFSDRERYLQLLFDSTLHPMVVIDRGNAICHVNKAASILFDRPKEGLPGKDLFSVLKGLEPEKETALKDQIRSVFDTGLGSVTERLTLHLTEPRFYTCTASRIISRYGPDEFSEEIVLSLYDMTKEYARDAEMKQYEWLTEVGDIEQALEGAYIGTADGYEGHGQDRMISGQIDRKLLTALSEELMRLLGSSLSVFEKDGTPAMILSVSSWSRETRSYERHWEVSGRETIETGLFNESQGPDGLMVFGAPILVYGSVVGAIVVEYGNPPKDPEAIAGLAAVLGLPLQPLQAAARHYKPRPKYIIDVERYRIKTISLLISEMIERKKSEEELQQVQNLKRIGYLAGGIAHDFNNIMTGVYGYISMARVSAEGDEGLMSLLGEAELSLDRASALSSKLLTFAKGSVSERETFDLEALIRDVVTFELTGSSIVVEFDVQDDLYALHADRTHYEQVFSNLVHNAVQAMDTSGRLSIRIRNSSVREEPRLLVTITDTGKGIPEKDLDHIFDPFFTSKEKGTGLGLATVHSVVTNDGGTIQVTSEIGTGTTFVLSLPAVRDQQRQEVSSRGSTVDIAGMRVLVMDDQEQVRSICLRILEGEVSFVRTAVCGEEVLREVERAAAADEKYDLAILDITVQGGLGGLQIMDTLLGLDPGIRVILMSGYADHTIPDSSASDRQTFLPKPFTRTRLLDAVASVFVADCL